jgi:hypothetical protein
MVSAGIPVALEVSVTQMFEELSSRKFIMDVY